MTFKKNEIVSIKAESLNHSGEAVAFIGKSKIIVTGLLPGETADVKIIKPGKNVSFGKIFEITKKSGKRVVSMCSNAGCGACELLFASYDHQLETKGSFISEIFKAEVNIERSGQTGYRNKIILPVRRVVGDVHIGTYRRNSHEVVDWKNACPLVPEGMYRIISKAKQMLIFNDNLGKSEQLFIRGGSEGYQVGLIVSAPDEGIVTALHELAEAEPNITSTFYSLSSGTNSVLVTDPVFVTGTDHAVLKTLNGIYKVSPQSFFQANIFTLDLILKKIGGLIRSIPEPKVLDIYSGCGVLSDLPGLKRTCIELNPSSFIHSDKNDDSEFITADVPGVINEIISGGHNIIIADPPRKGIDGITLNAIDSSGADMLIYLSCSPETQKRDIDLLKNYSVSEIIGYDMFPNTIQIESLAVLKRR